MRGAGSSGMQSTHWLSRMTHTTCNVLPIANNTSAVLSVELGTWAELQGGAQPFEWTPDLGSVPIATIHSC